MLFSEFARQIAQLDVLLTSQNRTVVHVLCEGLHIAEVKLQDDGTGFGNLDVVLVAGAVFEPERSEDDKPVCPQCGSDAWLKLEPHLQGSLCPDCGHAEEK